MMFSSSSSSATVSTSKRTREILNVFAHSIRGHTCERWYHCKLSDDSEDKFTRDEMERKFPSAIGFIDSYDVAHNDDDADDEAATEWQVKCIVDKDPDTNEYKVQWMPVNGLDFPDTWEPLENISGCFELLKQFEKRRRNDETVRSKKTTTTQNRKSKTRESISLLSSEEWTPDPGSDSSVEELTTISKKRKATKGKSKGKAKSGHRSLLKAKSKSRKSESSAKTKSRTRKKSKPKRKKRKVAAAIGAVSSSAKSKSKRRSKRKTAVEDSSDGEDFENGSDDLFKVRMRRPIASASTSSASPSKTKPSKKGKVAKGRNTSDRVAMAKAMSSAAIRREKNVQKRRQRPKKRAARELGVGTDTMRESSPKKKQRLQRSPAPKLDDCGAGLYLLKSARTRIADEICAEIRRQKPENTQQKKELFRKTAEAQMRVIHNICVRKLFRPEFEAMQSDISDARQRIDTEIDAEMDGISQAQNTLQQSDSTLEKTSEVRSSTLTVDTPLKSASSFQRSLTVENLTSLNSSTLTTVTESVKEPAVAVLGESALKKAEVDLISVSSNEREETLQTGSGQKKESSGSVAVTDTKSVPMSMGPTFELCNGVATESGAVNTESAAVSAKSDDTIDAQMRSEEVNANSKRLLSEQLDAGDNSDAGNLPIESSGKVTETAADKAVSGQHSDEFETQNTTAVDCDILHQSETEEGELFGILDEGEEVVLEVTSKPPLALV